MAITLFTALGVALAGCASTKVTSFRDPIGNRRYSVVVVAASFSDLDSRSTTEGAFVSALAAQGVKGIPSMTIWPPTRDYNGAELDSTARAAGADGILFVDVTDSYSDQEYIPETSRTSGTATTIGKTTNYSANTWQSGGYYASKARVNYKVTLVDVEAGRQVWQATALNKASGTATSFSTMASSLASSSVDRLVRDAMLAKAAGVAVQKDAQSVGARRN
jgi:O6-methylguanine-DNA--protein-cysteine methyltransferase